MSWSMGAERLIPGAPLATNSQQPSTPPQPGEVQQPQPQQPLPDGGTTVVTVSVPKSVGFDISVVEGEGGSNIVDKKSSTKVVVQVRDDKNQALEGAVVTFTAPADGPSVIFSNGFRTATVLTDADGRAPAPSMRAVNGGSFSLDVSASFRGQTVNTTISQTNYESAAEAKGKPASTPEETAPTANKARTRLSGTTWAIILGAGAAAAVGIGVGLSHKGSSSSTTGSSTTITGPGTPTVGQP
jgi:hypothetical protein